MYVGFFPTLTYVVEVFVVADVVPIVASLVPLPAVVAATLNSKM